MILTDEVSEKTAVHKQYLLRGLRF